MGRMALCVSFRFLSFKVIFYFVLVRSDFDIQLDNAHACFLAPEKLLVSLKGGELYLFHLVTDVRSIQKIVITKAGASVLTVCVSLTKLYFLIITLNYYSKLLF